MKSIIIRADSEEALLEVMESKVRAARCLKAALTERDALQQALLEVDGRIDQLTKDAAVEFEGEGRGPTLR